MEKRKNPLLFPFNTPHEAIPFNQIEVRDFEEAILQGIQQHDIEIDAITCNPSSPTFENTIDSFEKSGALLNVASTAFFNLLNAETSEEMDQMAEKLTPIITEHANKTLHNKRLFERVKHVYQAYVENKEQKKTLSTEQRTLLVNIYDDFVRSGADLNETDQQQFEKLSMELSLLGIQFSQNHLKDLNAFTLQITDENMLEGIPQSVIDTAKEEASTRDKDGWVFTLHAPCYTPFMTYCKNRSLRERMYMAYNTLCTHSNENNNEKIVVDIVNKRRQLAQLMGYIDFATYTLTKRMAENKENVNKLFSQLIEAYLPIAKQEVSEVAHLATEMEGKDFKLMPWDFSYYSNKLKEQKFQVNSEMLRPYLELSNVIKGVFGLAERLYGISFKRNKNIPVFHPDVETYDVFDKNGEFLALLYCDFFPRPSKKSGAWMTSYKEQFIDKNGINHRPHVSITTNFPKPTSRTPSLLTLGELSTFLHEFGHALHGIFANTTYQYLSGTNVYWDFVELPSQLMENYSVEQEFLMTFATHYKTHEMLPTDLIDRVKMARNFNVAYACMRQVSFGLLDMNYYSMNHPLKESVFEIEQIIFDQTRLLPNIDGTNMSVQFSHIMSGGYATGYYSYKWAEILDADAFSFFQETGIFNTHTAQKFRDEILSKGGTEHPMLLYKRFRGKTPSIHALLVRDGILS